MEQLVEFVFSEVGLALMAATAATGISLIYWDRHRQRADMAIIRVVQNEPAPQEQIDGLLERGGQQNQQDFVRAELAAIRQRYGLVRRGHIAWVRMKLDGRVAKSDPAPNFEKDSW